MITYTVGNILTDPAQALVNPVNCEGAVSGLAQQFRAAYPQNHRAYQGTCISGWLRPGRVLPVPVGQSRYIVNLPTKDDPFQPSRLEWVQGGLRALAEEISRLGLKSVAIPPLGCGQGRLRWDEVKPLTLAAFQHLPDVQVAVYLPSHKLPGGKWLVPVGTPGAVYCGRGRGLVIPDDPDTEGHWGSPIRKGSCCPICRAVHCDNAATLPCYARHLYRKLSDDVWAEGFLQMMEESQWLACYCWRHNCVAPDCILPECHTRVMAAVYELEKESIARRIRQG